MTAMGDVLGTPSYTAPGQAAGRVHDLGPAVDVYAWGVFSRKGLSFHDRMFKTQVVLDVPAAQRDS
jgi:hypothetical protein